MISRRAWELAEDGVAFVEAVVVRCAAPTCARPGDRAIVLADGTIEGFVGGTCAEASLRLHALRCLETGEPMLLRIVPEAGSGRRRDDALEGAVTVANPCLSGGALELFVEPRLPAPRVVVIGDTPIAAALGALGERAGFATAGDDPRPDDAALVVASHGRGEEAALERALHEGVPYVGLVASRTRGAAVVGALDVPDALRARVHVPAGLDIGARTPKEIALSILAEIVQHRRGDRRAGAAAEPDTAVDPVCGMEVAVGSATPSFGGHWFCCEGCRDTYAAAHASAG